MGAEVSREGMGGEDLLHIPWRRAKLSGNYRYLLRFRGMKLFKKEIFALLCRPNAFNGSNLDFFLAKNRCLICMSNSSKALLITGTKYRKHWNFISTPKSKFHMVAYLQQTWRRELQLALSKCYSDKPRSWNHYRDFGFDGDDVGLLSKILRWQR